MSKKTPLEHCIYISSPLTPVVVKLGGKKKIKIVMLVNFSTNCGPFAFHHFYFFPPLISWCFLSCHLRTKDLIVHIHYRSHFCDHLSFSLPFVHVFVLTNYIVFTDWQKLLAIVLNCVMKEESAFAVLFVSSLCHIRMMMRTKKLQSSLSCYIMLRQEK